MPTASTLHRSEHCEDAPASTLMQDASGIEYKEEALAARQNQEHQRCLPACCTSTLLLFVVFAVTFSCCLKSAHAEQHVVLSQRGSMKNIVSGVFWIFLYLLVVLLPLFVFLSVRPTPEPRGFWVEFSIALGFIGLSQMALQFLLIARYRHLTAPYGIDLILKYHRQIALLAISLIVAHPIILVVENPALLPLLNPFGGTWASRSGNASIYALLLLTLLSLLRKQIKLSYEAWRISHAALSIAAIIFAHIHVSLAGQYTNTWWKEAALITITVTLVSFFVYLRFVKPWLQQRRPYSVVSVSPEQGDTWVLSLEPKEHAGFSFHPGQFAWLKFGKSAYTMTEHPFSFCTAPDTSGKLSFGIKALGDFTKTIKDIPLGTTAYVDGPHGAFSIDLIPAAGYVFIAGGVGITPFISMLETMAERKDKRPVQLFYGENTWESAAFHEEIAVLEKQLALEVIYVLNNPPEDWQGEVGFVTQEVLQRHWPDEGIIREYLICGPNPMIDAMENAIENLGVPLQRVHSERFDLV